MLQPDSTPTALEDVIVLDLCDEKGQLMGKLLGDMGAQVIKIEPPEGDGARRVGPFKDDTPDPDRSLYFWEYNTSKASISLNIETKAGQDILKRLVERADILLESFQPGYLDSLGLGYETLSKINPRLIMTSLTGFGQTGPYRDYLTSDLVALAMGGPMASCGYDDVPGSPPIRGGGGQGYHIGSHYGMIGTLMALAYRDATGLGQYVDASIHEACSCTTEAAMPQYFYAKAVPKRQTGRHHGVQPSPHTQYRTKDGQLFTIFAVLRDLSSWLQLVSWMDEKGMAGDLKEDKYRQAAINRVRGGEETAYIFKMIGNFIGAMTAEEMYHGAQQRGFPWAIVRSPEETLDDPHLWDREFFVKVNHPELSQDYIYPGAPYILNKTPWSVRRAPLLGEDNQRIYVEELGFTQQELTTLKEGGVV